MTDHDRTDDARGTPDAEALAAAVADELDLPDFEDMKNANAAAIREELTVTEMGGRR